ncbi:MULTISPECIES: hypothetical protein [unclassified Rhodococcus (in: high G+C Gram-positive bacteria)]|uniref:hypothetical protein n=1 Tax=unclassified Rhodococcus (in: high G+C Gram-positive bacteria) TaxID=192944 RepID=UPI001C9A6A05|nr:MULTISPECIES: hypothetical protein [unclassified Rhodococcus (in: high G+C Gram-positive bacteria)]MBY6709133.1 hypothetical protein [Rhodococcus sp. BP-241]
MTGTMPAVWLLDAVTTIGAFGLLAIGLYLLARSGSFRAPKSGAHWTAIAILLFVAARSLHLPAVEDYIDNFPISADGEHLYNLPYILTILSTTLALGFCVPATAWIAGAPFRVWAPHVLAFFTSVVIIGSFAISDLWRKPIQYFPDEFAWTWPQIVLWSYVALTISLVATIALRLIARAATEFDGAIRIMLLIIASASVTAILFAIHIVVRVFLVNAFPDLFSSAYVQNASQIAVALTTLVTVQLVAALLVPQIVKLRGRVSRFRLLYERKNAWRRSRETPHRNAFDEVEVPRTAAECWSAAASPVTAYRMRFELTEVDTRHRPST